MADRLPLYEKLVAPFLSSGRPRQVVITCAQCGLWFLHSAGPGRRPRYCSERCRRRQRANKAVERRRSATLAPSIENREGVPLD